MEKQTYESDLVLGEKYRDRTTGIEGHLIGVYFYEHACERATLRYVDGDKNVKEFTFDAPELIHVESGNAATADRPGGPDRGDTARPAPTR